ncbi:MAG: hypothetical protein ABI831_05340 [Betaproteobacteria bacterium]
MSLAYFDTALGFASVMLMLSRLMKTLRNQYEALFDELGKQGVQDLQADYEKVRGWVEASQLELGPDSATYCGGKVDRLSLAGHRLRAGRRHAEARSRHAGHRALPQPRRAILVQPAAQHVQPASHPRGQSGKG